MGPTLVMYLGTMGDGGATNEVGIAGSARWWSREGGRVVDKAKRKSLALLGFWPWLRSRWGEGGGGGV